MADGVQMDFKGGKQLEHALLQLPKELRGEILSQSLVAGADPIRVAAAARARVRRGRRRRPGTVELADSIRISLGEQDATHAVVDVGTKIPYAHLVEFGHRIVPRGPSRKGLEGRRRLRVALRERQSSATGQVPAYPFLRPAMDEQKETALARIGEVLGKETETAFRRLAPNE
ncbi:MAG: HK97-gp10 family putative phage morphogenesis protein [bacterium]